MNSGSTRAASFTTLAAAQPGELAYSMELLAWLLIEVLQT